MKTKIGDVLNLIRIKHYIKNCLIFLPMVCANKIYSQNIISCILAFISFSFASSFVYVINDIKDIEKDKLHPRKRNRPLASGAIKVKTALFISGSMLVIGLVIGIYLDVITGNQTLALLLIYLFINVVYSFGIKNIAVFDIMLLSICYILRIYFGAAVVDVRVSEWLFMTILTASLFLIFGKRKKELETNENVREVLREYSVDYLQHFQYLSLALTIVFYSLWTMEQNVSYTYCTIPLLIMIFMRYCLVMERRGEGDPTTILYEDKPLIVMTIGYAMCMMFLLTHK